MIVAPRAVPVVSSCLWGPVARVFGGRQDLDGRVPFLMGSTAMRGSLTHTPLEGISVN